MTRRAEGPRKSAVATSRPLGSRRPAAARVADEEFFAGETASVARRLVGATLVHGGCGGTIVEVEAYTDDPASHFVTRPRTGAIMGTTHGRIYVYQIYGVHRCLNVTTHEGGVGAVLIRALEPTHGLERMRRRRGVERVEDLCSGPGKVAQALGVSQDLTGEPVASRFRIELPAREPPIVAAPRVGISEATDLPWRFCLEGSRFVSRPRPRASGPTPAEPA